MLTLAKNHWSLPMLSQIKLLGPAVPSKGWHSAMELCHLKCLCAFKTAVYLNCFEALYKWSFLVCLVYRLLEIQRHYQLSFPLFWTGDTVMSTVLSEVSARKVEHIWTFSSVHCLLIALDQGCQITWIQYNGGVRLWKDWFNTCSPYCKY